MPESDDQSRLSDRVAKVMHAVDHMVGSGVLKPGQAISEPELCRRLDVGRVPVREAIRILAGEGLLELVPNKSARVRVVTPEEIAQRFVVLNGLTLVAVESLVQLTELRQAVTQLRPVGKRLAVLSLNPDAMKIMREVSRYHGIIFAHCGNRYLQQMVDSMHMHHYRLRISELADLQSLAISAREYPRITTALARADVEAVRRLMQVYAPVLGSMTMPAVAAKAAASRKKPPASR